MRRFGRALWIYTRGSLAVSRLAGIVNSVVDLGSAAGMQKIRSHIVEGIWAGEAIEPAVSHERFRSELPEELWRASGLGDLPWCRPRLGTALGFWSETEDIR